MPRNDAHELRQAYDHDGYVIAREVIDRDLAQEACDHVNWLLAKNPELRPEDLHHNLMIGDPFWHRLISDPRLLDLAEVFIGSNLALFATHYIAKAPKTGRPVLWHQDGSYWPLEPMEVVTLWLAFDDSTRENGCLRVLPGTQNVALQEMHRRTDVTNVLSSAIDDNFVDESAAVDVILAAGDVSIHHPNIIHGSDANTSPLWRRGLTIRYIPTSTEILHPGPDLWPSCFHLRGNAVPGINVYRPFPKYSPETSIPFRGCQEWATKQ